MAITYKFPGHEMITLYPFFPQSDAVFVGALGGILFFENPGIFKHKIFHWPFFVNISLYRAI